MRWPVGVVRSIWPGVVELAVSSTQARAWRLVDRTSVLGLGNGAGGPAARFRCRACAGVLCLVSKSSRSDARPRGAQSDVLVKTTTDSEVLPRKPEAGSEAAPPRSSSCL